MTIKTLHLLLQVLFEELQLDLKLPQNSKKIARTSVNQEKSTSEAVLTQLQDLHPLPKIVLEYRQVGHRYYSRRNP